MFKKQEKESGTNFLLFSITRNVIGQFVKICLHEAIKNSQFLIRGSIQKCLFIMTSKDFNIFNYTAPTYNKEFFYMLFTLVL